VQQELREAGRSDDGEGSIFGSGFFPGFLPAELVPATPARSSIAGGAVIVFVLVLKIINSNLTIF
jgi:hypothetical protein